MGGFQTSATIDASREAVFDAVTDLDNASKLSPSVVRIEPLTEGPVREGYVFRETRTMGSREVSADIRITAFDPPNAYSASSDYKGSTFTYTYTLADAPGGGTELTLTCTAKLKGVLTRLMAPMIFAAMKKLDGDHPVRVKELVEAGS